MLAGSETGMPYVWADETEQMLDNREYECKFTDVVSDVTWNPRYNMFAVVGFGHEFPVLVYVYERDAKEVEELQFRFGGQLTSAVGGGQEEGLLEDDPQNANAYRGEDVSNMVI